METIYLVRDVKHCVRQFKQGDAFRAQLCADRSFRRGQNHVKRWWLVDTALLPHDCAVVVTE